MSNTDKSVEEIAERISSLHEQETCFCSPEAFIKCAKCRLKLAIVEALTAKHQAYEEWKKKAEEAEAKLNSITVNFEKLSGCKTNPSSGHDSAEKIYDKSGFIVPVFNGYWIWWCVTHKQPMHRCTMHNLEQQIQSLSNKLSEAERDSKRLDWIDKNCSFVCNEPYNIGPYGIGELRKMADDGINAYKHKPTTLRENLGQG